MTRLTNRFAGWSALALASLALAAPAVAQTWPARPITLIVPFAAGGPTDTTARLVANSLSQTLGQQVIVENVAGAGGTVGTQRMAKAAPDGYTLELHHFGFASSVAFYKNPGYDPVNSAEHLGLINSNPLTITAKNGFPARTLAELIAKMKADGDKITLAHAGIGSASYKCGMSFLHAIGAKATLVAYRGTGPAMNDLVAGHVDVLCDQITNTIPQIEAKKIQVYAITSTARSPNLPEVPTADEAGLKGFSISVWHGLYAPKGTPADVQTKLHDALQKALDDKTVVERFGQLGASVFAGDERKRDAHLTRVKSESELWRKIAKEMSISGE